MSSTLEINRTAVIAQEIPLNEAPRLEEQVTDETHVDILHPADQAAAEIRQHLDQLFSLVSSSPTKQREDFQRRAQYLQRLQSFTTVEYFAQPIQLSPIICALTGWELLPQKEKESTRETGVLPLSPSSSLCDSAPRLSCRSCHAEVLLWIPSVLSTTGQADLVQQYQQLLWKSHAIQCRHRKEAEYLINTALQPPKQPLNDTILVVPTLLARSIQLPPSAASNTSPSSLELVEQSNPLSLFCQKWRKFYSHLLPPPITPVQLPEAVLQFDADSASSSSSCGTLLTRLVNRIQEKEQEERNYVMVDTNQSLQQAAAEAAAALVLLGWELKLSAGESSDDAPASIHCIFCLAQHPLIASREDHLLSSSRKRPRDAVFSLWNQPWAAHRYYCPWVCGFPQTGRSDTTRPLWETVATRLLSTRYNNDDEEDLTSSAVRQRIRAGVSPMRYSAQPRRK